ncbi:MAG: phosphoribosylamine--glycine ligase, partial [Cellulomonas sp.]|uniref:phosphoribosylglycinamide synthetase C domain-containing protein n=1 Tax=Cellulomonas sp. TaxID=40001 RepID=UPI001791640A
PGGLGQLAPLEWLDAAAVTGVIAANGYPADVRGGDPITGLEDADALPGVHVLHAGTALAHDADGDHLVAAGGRVLSVVGVGADLPAARAAAYAGVERIGLPGSHHRTDVALLAD